MRVLAGDVGGTHARLALYERQEGSFLELRRETYPSADFASLSEVARAFLGHSSTPVDRAGIGVAGPVHEGRCKATNLPWTIDAERFAGELGIGSAHLVNDFHAIALGLDALGPGDLEVLQDHPAESLGPRALLGAGTGLGEAIILPEREGPPRVLSSEGGHTDFAPRNETEIELLRFLLRRHARVSVERVVSGPGLKAIYDFLVETKRAVTTSKTCDRLAEEDAGKVIGESALSGADDACAQAVDLFVAAYGAEAGNLALKVLPAGGVFLAGGIAPRLLPRLTDGPFLDAFRTKGRMSSILETTRVSVILNTDVGLLGARTAAISS